MSKQVFKAPDGKEFSTRKEMREYVMDKFYSFKNKNNEHELLVKNPGDIDGQVFDISDCNNCTIVVMDVTDQVQIDNLNNCKVLIGCGSSAVYIRNCYNCLFYVCTRQFRIRDTNTCQFYSYSQSEIHIELSNKLSFGPFLGGYPQQQQQFAKVGLDPQQNLWYDIYDHNDPAKTGENWELIPDSAYQKPWFPNGNCGLFISTSKGILSSNKNQVGETYSLEQMISDSQKQQSGNSDGSSEKKKPEIIVDTKTPAKELNAKQPMNFTSPTSFRSHAMDKLGMEVALLVASALEKKIDITIWMNCAQNNGLVDAREFDRKLISLASTVGINEDSETKQELEIGTSAESLRVIHDLFSSGTDSNGNVMIDVPNFLKISQSKVDSFLAELKNDSEFESSAPVGSHLSTELQSTGESEEEHFNTWTDGSNVSDNGYSATFDELKDDPDIMKMSVEEYIEDLKEKGKPTYSRPKSAPPGGHVARNSDYEPPAKDSGIKVMIKKNGKPHDIIANNELLDQSKVHAVPSSPYDEEVSFDDEDEIDSTYLANRSASKKPKSSPVKSSSSGQIGADYWEKENRRYLNTSGYSESEPVMANINRHSSPTQLRPKLATSQSDMRNLSRESKKPMERRHSFNNLSKQHKDVRSSSASRRVSTEERIQQMKQNIEDMVRSTVRKADMYHMIQVHLGYIKPYTMIPARGSIIASTPREWLYNRDLQTAFLAGRLILNEQQIVVLKSLVCSFSKKYDELYGNSNMVVVPDETAKKPKKEVLGPNQAINSDWFRRYLVHMRLAKVKAAIEAPVRSSQRSLSASGRQSRTITKSLSAPVPVVSSVAVSREAPLQWKEWLSAKLKGGIQRDQAKPKEFEKAIDGLPYSLKKDELIAMLHQHDVLPPELIQREISCRVASWELDISGRRDFQHELNLQIRKELRNDKRDWKRLTEKERKELKESKRKKIIHDKTEEFRRQERETDKITIELFWKFDQSRKDCEYRMDQTFVEWFESYLDKSERGLAKFKEEEMSRLKLLGNDRVMRKSLAGLNDIEKKLGLLASSLDSEQRIELQKSLVTLRKSAATSGLAHGKVVTKADFDKHIKDVLAPHIKSSPEDNSNNLNGREQPLSVIWAKGNKQLGQKINELFHLNLDEAVQTVLNIEKAKNEEKSIDFQEWLQKKNREKKEQLKKEVSRCIYFCHTSNDRLI